MEYVSTQAFNYDDICIQPTEVTSNESNEKEQIGALHIENTNYPIFKGINTVGRDPNSDVYLNNVTVSKNHAEVEAESATSIFILDNNSSNGTLLDNIIIKKKRCYQIFNGSKISFGEVKAVFKIGLSNKETKDEADISRYKLNCSSPEQIMNTTTVNDLDISRSINILDISSIPCSQIPAKGLGNHDDSVVVSIVEESVDQLSETNIDEGKTELISKTDEKSDIFDKSDDDMFEEICDGDLQTNCARANVDKHEQTLTENDSCFHKVTEKSSVVDDSDLENSSLTKSNINDEKSIKMVKPINWMAVHSTPMKKDHNFAVPETPALRSKHQNASNSSIISMSQMSSSVNEKTLLLNRSEDFDNSKENEKIEETIDDDIFDAPTQRFTQASSSGYGGSAKSRDSSNGIYDADTQASSSISDSIFDATTQNFGNKKTETNKSIYDLETQHFENKNNDIFNAATQSCIPENKNKNQDIFDAPTQVFAAKSSESVKNNDVGIYDMETQEFDAENTVTREQVVSESDSETDEEGVFESMSPTKKIQENSKNNTVHEDSANESTNLLETQSAKEFFSREVKENSKTIFEEPPQVSKTPVTENHKIIFDEPTQVSHLQDSDDSDIDEEGVFETQPGIHDAVIQLVCKKVLNKNLLKSESNAEILDESSNDSINLLETQSAAEFLGQVKSIFNVETPNPTKKLDSSIFEDKTQIPGEVLDENSSSNDSINFLQTQSAVEFLRKTEQIFDAKTQVLGEKASEVDIIDAPTQVIANKTEKEKETNIFDAPTQIFVNNAEKENVFDAPTQIIQKPVLDSDSDTDEEGEFTQNLKASNIFDAVTQKVGNESILDMPTRVIASKPQGNQKTVIESESETDNEGEFVRKDIFDKVTQNVVNKNILDMPTQVVAPKQQDNQKQQQTRKTIFLGSDSENDSSGSYHLEEVTENIFDAATQPVENSVKEETDPNELPTQLIEPPKPKLEDTIDLESSCEVATQIMERRPVFTEIDSETDEEGKFDKKEPISNHKSEIDESELPTQVLDFTPKLQENELPADVIQKKKEVAPQINEVDESELPTQILNLQSDIPGTQIMERTTNLDSDFETDEEGQFSSRKEKSLNDTIILPATQEMPKTNDKPADNKIELFNSEEEFKGFKISPSKRILSSVENNLRELMGDSLTEQNQEPGGLLTQQLVDVLQQTQQPEEPRHSPIIGRKSRFKRSMSLKKSPPEKVEDRLKNMLGESQEQNLQDVSSQMFTQQIVSVLENSVSEEEKSSPVVVKQPISSRREVSKILSLSLKKKDDNIKRKSEVPVTPEAEVKRARKVEEVAPAAKKKTTVPKELKSADKMKTEKKTEAKKKVKTRESEKPEIKVKTKEKAKIELKAKTEDIAAKTTGTIRKSTRTKTEPVAGPDSSVMRTRRKRNISETSNAADNSDDESQNYYASIKSKRKKNVIKDSQDLKDSEEEARPKRKVAVKKTSEEKTVEQKVAEQTVAKQKVAEEKAETKLRRTACVSKPKIQPDFLPTTRSTRSSKSAAPVSSGTLKLSLTKKNDVWESVPLKTPKRSCSLESIQENMEILENVNLRPRKGRVAKKQQDFEEEDLSKAGEESQEVQAILKKTTRSVGRPAKKAKTTVAKGAKVKVLFTGIDVDRWQSSLHKLGIIVANTVATCSILLTDKIRRTHKFLCAIAYGKPILSMNWLKDSVKAEKCLENWDDYILEDPKSEQDYGFYLRESLERARKQKLFQGYSIVLTPKIKNPSVVELKDMIRASDGTPLVSCPRSWPEKVIIISTKDDIENAKKFAAKAPKEVTVHSVEFILSAILKQDINFKIYKLKV